MRERGRTAERRIRLSGEPSNIWNDRVINKRTGTIAFAGVLDSSDVFICHMETRVLRRSAWIPGLMMFHHFLSFE